MCSTPRCAALCNIRGAGAADAAGHFEITPEISIGEDTSSFNSEKSPAKIEAKSGGVSEHQGDRGAACRVP
jgi:hypothetical protein